MQTSVRIDRVPWPAAAATVMALCCACSAAAVRPSTAAPPAQAPLAAGAKPATGARIHGNGASIARAPFGQADGKPVELYTLTNVAGLTVKIMTYGATVVAVLAPDRAGARADLVLGFDTLDGYLTGNPYMGVTVGRVANRIRNAGFQLAGKEYKVAANDGAHHLHGGNKGWDKVIWNAEPRLTDEGPSLRLSYVSRDGDEGYPGNVTATTTYTLTHRNELRVDMEAVTDAPTIVSMAHHSYWNLGGHDSGTILDHQLSIAAESYTPGDPSVPTGVVRSVRATPLDFTAAKAIGRDIREAGGTGNGYDHNWVVSGDPRRLRPVARLKDPKSGRVMELEANQPGVQLYTGNLLDGRTKGKGVAYRQYAGLCLETQQFPNAINVPAWRDDVLLAPGAVYRHTMIHRFLAE